MKAITILLVIYFVFLATTEISYTRKNITRTVKWNGLVWVLLDRYSINKYHSSDTPMPLFNYKKTHHDNA